MHLTRRPYRPSALTACASLWLSLGCGTQALAQSNPETTVRSPQGMEKAAERIIHEDVGSRIDELRVGGETRTIEVQTKGALPSYWVQPQTANQPNAEPNKAAGKSAWRLFAF